MPASPALPRRPLAVVFDMDGTLLDTEAVHRTAMRAAAGRLGLGFPDALFRDLVGIHRDANTRRLLDHFGGDFPSRRRSTPTPTRASRRCGATACRCAPVRARRSNGWQARRFPIAIATSTASPFAEQRLAHAGLADFFATVVTRSDVTRPKPDAEPYALAAARLGIDPRACVAVEDSPNGLRAAAAAGMMALLVPDLVPRGAGRGRARARGAAGPCVDARADRERASPCRMTDRRAFLARKPRLRTGRPWGVAKR